MKTKMMIDLRGFEVPNSLPEKASIAAPTPREFKLSEIDADVLQSMCDDFTRRVFKVAGKRPPAIEGEAR